MSERPGLIGSDVFDAWYYANSCGRPYRRDPEWLAFFGAIADRIASDIQPRTVLDVGCAMGFLVEALRSRNVEAFGIDTSSFAIDRAAAPIKPFCREGSVTREFDREYDLITVVEVLEHVPPHDADRAIDNICGHTRDVLFSSSPFDYKEATHVNVRPPEYWAEQFARRGFFRDTAFDASFLTAWAVRFRKGCEPVHRIVADYERVFSRVEIERNNLRGETLAMQGQLSAMASRLAGVEAELQSVRRQAVEVTAVSEMTTRLAHAEQELQTLRRQTADVTAAFEAEARVARAEAVEARATITAMERSRFWRLRRMWVAIRRHLWNT